MRLMDTGSTPLPRAGKLLASGGAAPAEYTIHELAAETGTTVSNIRCYRNRNLLPSPDRRDNLGIYSEVHAARLRIINELLQRGYSLDNIEEMMTAWQSGGNLDSILGIDTALLKPFSAEMPMQYSLTDLRNMFGKQLTAAVIDRALALQYLHLQGDHFVAPRPTMVQAAATLVELGFPLMDLLHIVGNLRTHLQAAANATLGLVAQAPDGSASPASQRPHIEDIVGHLRSLVDRVVASEMGWALDVAIRNTLGERVDQLGHKPRSPADAR